MKELIKKDSKNCTAKLTGRPVFYNNDNRKYWIGVVHFLENGDRLFTLKSEIVRTSFDDAVKDAELIALDNGF